MSKIGEALRATSSDEAMGLDGLPTELLEHGLCGEAREILYNFHSIIAAV